MWAVVVLSFALVGSDPADDPAPPTPAVPELASGAEDNGPPRTAPPTVPDTAPPPSQPAPSSSDPADPADPVDQRPTPTRPPATPAPATAPHDPDDEVVPSTPPDRRLAPEAPPVDRPPADPVSPETRLPIATGAIVALGGCGAGALPLVGTMACPYSACLAPATGCCGTIGTAATMASQSAGNPIAAGGAAAAGVISGGVLGGVAGAGVALALASAGCLEDSMCVIAMVAVVGGGAAVGATFVGPILGGGAVTVVEHVRQGELSAKAPTPPTPQARTTPDAMPDGRPAQAL